MTASFDQNLAVSWFQRIFGIFESIATFFVIPIMENQLEKVCLRTAGGVRSSL
jgi:hypothetical protein